MGSIPAHPTNTPRSFPFPVPPLAFVAEVASTEASLRCAGVQTVLLLLASNVFMTVAWYGHLKFGRDWPLWQAIVVSWGIALIEYCLAVPANRMGYGQFSGFQLKIIQEVATLTVFIGFAMLVLRERFAWNYAMAFLCLACAVGFAFYPPATP
ncbi:DMT family protein [Candidatus Symbiobacter mobilis]|nr:DMT family protein [Candidatus Symbiobacter mobilis]